MVTRYHGTLASAGAWVVTWVLAAAAVQTGPLSARGEPPSSRGVPVQQAGAAPARPVVLEFDLPDAFPKAAGSAKPVTGFRVGFFRAKDASLIRAVDVGVDMLPVQGRTARLTLPADALLACGDDCSIRVQTVSSDAASAWSAPVPLVPQRAGAETIGPARPARPRGARPERTPAARGARQAPVLTARDIQTYPALSSALRELLPKDANMDAELKRFRGVQELALVVAISREYDVSFAALSKAIEGPPRVSPRDALSRLRRDLNARSAIRTARARAQQLMQTEERRSVQ